MSYTILIPQITKKYSKNRGRFKPDPKITEYDVTLISEHIEKKYSRYYITYSDILKEYKDISYKSLAKFMSKLVSDLAYERRGTSNEAHFILNDSKHIKLYEQYDIPKWKAERSFALQQKHKQI